MYVDACRRPSVGRPAEHCYYICTLLKSSKHDGLMRRVRMQDADEDEVLIEGDRIRA